MIELRLTHRPGQFLCWSWAVWEADALIVQGPMHYHNAFNACGRGLEEVERIIRERAAT